MPLNHVETRFIPKYHFKYNIFSLTAYARGCIIKPRKIHTSMYVKERKSLLYF